jgi:tetratricopeptide (TPR) repeat protein
MSTSLNELLETHGTWQACAEFLAMEEETAPDDAARVQAMTLRSRVLADELGQRGEAIRLLEAVAELDFEQHGAMDLLATLYRRSERWKDLATLLVDRLDVVTDPEARALLLLEAAQVFAGRLEGGDMAVQLLPRALQEAGVPTPAVVEAVLALAPLLPAPEQAGDALLDVLPRAQAAGASAVVLAIQLTLGELFETTLQRPERALVHWEAALNLAPDDAELTRRLEARYRAAEDWEALLELFQRRAGPEPQARHVAWLLAQADLLAGPLDQPEQASALRAQAFGLAPADPAVRAAWQADLAARGAHAERAELLAEDAAAGDPSRWRDALEAASQAEPPPEKALAWARAWADASPDEPASWEAMLRLLPADARADRLDAMRQRVRLTSADAGPALRLALAEVLATEEDGLTEAIEVLRAAWQEAPGERKVGDALLAALERAGDAGAWVAWTMTLAGEEAWAQESAGLRTAAARRAAAPPLEDRARAIRLMEEHIALVPDDRPALQELAAWCEAEGRSAEAMGWLEKLAGSAAPEDVAPLVAMARMHTTEGDARAVEAWKAVLEREPEHGEALEALDRLWCAQEAWTELGPLLRRRIVAARDLAQRAALLQRLGDLYQGPLGDEALAVEAWEEALALQPDAAGAAAALAQWALRQEHWERLPALLGVMLQDAESRDDKVAEGTIRWHRARALRALHRHREAAEDLQRLLTGQNENLEVMRALADALQADGQWEAAEAQWQVLLEDDHPDDPVEARVALWKQAARCALHQRDAAVAAARWQKVLTLAPDDNDALRALAEGTGEHDSEASLEARARLLALVTDPLEQRRLLVELGDALHQAGRPREAIARYREALVLEPGSRGLLHKLLALHTECEDWEDATGVLQVLADAEPDIGRRSRLRLAIAAMFRDQLRDLTRAGETLEAHLDEAPDALEAFEMLVSMWQQHEAWQPLERSHRRMLERVRGLPDTEDLQYTLLRGLGVVYARHLGRMEDAFASWSLARRLRDDHADILALMLRWLPTDGSADDARIATHRALLLQQPDAVDSYHALFDLWEQRREWDRALRVASVLDVMGQATPREAGFYQQLQPRTLPLARRGLSAAEWSLLAHPDLDPALTQLFTILAGTAAASLAQPLSRWGVERRQSPVDLAQPSPMVNLYVYAAQMLGVPLPQLWTTPQATTLLNAHAAPRAMVAPPTLLQTEANRRMVFRVTFAMAQMHDPFYLASAYGTKDWLKALVYGTLAVFTGQLVPDPSEEAVRGCLRVIERQSRPVLEQLGVAVQALVAGDATVDIRGWLRAMDWTTGRVALLLCGDLSRALQALPETPGISDLTLAERSADLVEFSLSEAFEEVRWALGLGLGQQA